MKSTYGKFLVGGCLLTILLAVGRFSVAQTVNWEDADYLILVHDVLYDQAWVNGLVALKNAQGLSVALRKVYDGDSASFLKGGIEEAYTTGRVPTYVLLVGDAALDGGGCPLEGTDASVGSYIPTFHISTEIGGQYTAYDEEYALLEGGDDLPDVFLGRLPAQSASDMTHYVDKLNTYEAGRGQEEAWKRKVLLLTNDRIKNALAAPNFHAYFYRRHSELLERDYLSPTGLEGSILKSSDFPFGASGDGPRWAAFKDSLNRGALIVNCFGISGKHYLQQFYDNDPNTGYSDASELSSTGRYPFFVAACCHTGDFSGSASETAAQDFLFEANRGAIAWFSPYGNTNAYHDFWLAKEVYKKILGEGITAIGPATTLAKVAFMARYPEHKDSAQQFSLFGDPALRLAFNPGELVSDVSPSDPVVPTGTAYGNASGSGTGYVQMNWSANPESDIAGYKVYLFNGDQYQEVADVGKATSWSSQGKGVWPTLSEILNGGYLLHTDALGGELWDDPHWVYTNSPGTTYNTRTNYALRIKAYDYSGNLSGFSDAWAPTLPNTRFPTSQNPSFEQLSGSDIVDWETYGSGTFDSSTQHIDGTLSAHLSRTSAAGTFGFSQSYIAVQPNTTYYLGVWVKTQGVSSGIANAALGVWAGGEANHHVDFGAVSGTTDWTYISGSWTSQANEDRIGIKLYGYSEFVGESMA